MFSTQTIKSSPTSCCMLQITNTYSNNKFSQILKSYLKQNIKIDKFQPRTVYLQVRAKKESDAGVNQEGALTNEF